MKILEMAFLVMCGVVGVVLGAVLLAVTLFAIVALPGTMSDQESTVPLHQVQEAQQ